MGTQMAEMEGTEPVPGTPTDSATLRSEIRRLERSLNVQARLQGYSTGLRALLDQSDMGTKQRRGRYFVLELDVQEFEATLNITTVESLLEAQDRYAAAERASAGDPAVDVVLVSVESMESLKRAYPNYYADTSLFQDALDTAIS